MKKTYQQIISALLVAVMLVGSAYAEVVEYGAENNPNEKTYTQSFSDVPTDHWAFQYIEELVERKAINGYPDGKFYPDKIVTREEFAKIMIVAAGLAAAPAQASSYADVPLTYWASPFIETAKPYMTAYQSGGQAYFKPTDGALREDMAVAVVMLKGYDTRLADLSMIQTMFTDIDAISAGAQPYVALAVENGIISGYSDGTFRGQATITRCEAAAILWRAFQYGSDSKLMPGETAAPVPSSSAQPSQEEPTVSPEPTEPPAAVGKPYVVDTLASVDIVGASNLMALDSENGLIYFDQAKAAILSLNLEDGNSKVLLNTAEATGTNNSTTYTDFEPHQLFWDKNTKQLLVYGTFNSIRGNTDDGWTFPTTGEPTWSGIFTVEGERLKLFAEEPHWTTGGGISTQYFDRIEATLSNGDYIVRYRHGGDWQYYLYSFQTATLSTNLATPLNYVIAIGQSGKDIYRVSAVGGTTIYKYNYAGGEWTKIGGVPHTESIAFQNDICYAWSDGAIIAIRPSDGATQQKVNLEEDAETVDMRALPSAPGAFLVTADEEYLFYDDAAKAIRMIQPTQQEG